MHFALFCVLASFVRAELSYNFANNVHEGVDVATNEAAPAPLPSGVVGCI